MCLHQFGMDGAGGVFNVGVLMVQTGPSSHSPCDSDSVEPMTFSDVSENFSAYTSIRFFFLCLSHLKIFPTSWVISSAEFSNFEWYTLHLIHTY
jgi:hypothetical protein